VAKAKPKAKKRAQEPEPENMTIAETQPDPEPMDVDGDESVEQSPEAPEIPESMPPPARPARRRPLPRAEPTQRAVGIGRAGSASDNERGTSDPALRRKVGELTKKCESLQAKYDNLKEATMSGKESNFEQLRKKTDQIARGDFIPLLLMTTTNMSSRPGPRHPKSHEGGWRVATSSS
jgi:hypothetical protein